MAPLRLFFYLSLITPGLIVAQSDSYRLIREIDLKHAMAAPYANVIKLYDTAVDEARGRAYVSGSQTEFVSMIDLQKGEEIGTVTLPFRSTIHNLDCNPVNGTLFVFNNSTPAKLYAINPATSMVKGTYTYSNLRTGMAFDSQQNKVFLADGQVIQIVDGSTLTHLDSFSANMTTGGLAIDSTHHVLYAVSRGLIAGKVVVKCFELTAPYGLERKFEIASTVPLGNLCLDVVRDRLLLVTLNRIVEIRASTGAVVRTISLPSEATNEVYDTARQVLYMTDEDGYSGEGEGGSWSKLYRYDFTTAALDSMRMGDKCSTLAIDNRRGILVVPSMHSAWLELLHLETGDIDSVDTGESADEMALSPDLRTLYIAKRLGGSRILAYDRISGAVSEFRAGNWPAVVETDSSLNRLYVLNVFTSSISVIDPGTNRVVNTIRLTIPEARSDAIPVMHYNKMLKRLYLAFPEFNKILAVDLKTESEVKSFDLPGFRFNADSHGAIGVIQLTTAKAHNRLYSLQKREKKLKIFDLQTFALMDSIDVSTFWPGNTTFEGNLLGYDDISDRLFIGNRFFHPVTLAPAGMYGGQLWVGYAPDREKFYSIAEQGGWVTLFEIQANTLTTLSEHRLFQPSGDAAPVFFHDPYSNEFFISEFNYARLRHYDLDQMGTVAAEPPVALPARFQLRQNYPNPFNPITTIVWSVPQRGRVRLSVVDLLGRTVRELVDEELPAGPRQLRFQAGDLPAGVYFIFLQCGRERATKKIALIR